jgi:hypothetical protein
MDTLRLTQKDAAMRYCLSYAAPRKAGLPKNNKRMKSPLKGNKKRKSTGSTPEAMVDNSKGEEEEEGDTAPARYPKGLEVGVKFEWVFFGDVNKQYTLVFGDAHELAIFLVILMDSRYVVMQMNWPFLVTGESQ